MGLTKNNLLKLIRKVDSTFTAMTGQSISFMSIKGDYVLPLNYNLFTNLCSYVIKSEKGMEMCKRCNSDFAHIKEGKVWLRSCHMGLCTMNVLIRSKDSGDTIMTCGQVVLDTGKKEFFENLKDKAVQLGLDYDTLLEYAGQLRVITEEESMIRGQFMLLLAEYISIAEAELEARIQYQEEYENNLRLENKLKHMEFQFLQSQISPHFLFNTLNLLVRTAEMEGATKTSDLVYDLSELLRWAFRSKDSICRISEEIKSVSSYLNIQKVRFGDQLLYQIRVDEEIEEYLMPVLTIQPLVENAIIHGIQNANRAVQLNIDIAKCENEIHIDIHDTGNGISQEMLKQVRDHSNPGNGIQNVESRLKLYFGDQLTFHIDSKEGEETHISIRWQINQAEEKRL